jgi:hypothetical protein
MTIPDDLRDFLASGKQLKYPPKKCEAGRVRLHRLEDLVERTFRAQTYGTPHEQSDPHAGESGTYAVRGIDLVASCTGSYEPEGLLVWFPVEKRYGVVDTDHDYVMLFASDVRWSDIVKAPAAFINAEWSDPEDDDWVPTEILAPWHDHPWNSAEG